MIRDQSFIVSSFFSKKFNISFTTPSENNNTNIQLKKFIDTAILSADNQNHHLIGCIRLNQNVINACRSIGAQLAAHIFHHNTQKFSANTLGTYIYS
ncbi:MAG: hypothetical protein WCG25_02055 [bacterium]